MTETLIQHNGPLEIMDKREAAAFLRIRPRTLDDWQKRGLIPYCKLPSGSVRFRRDHLLAFVAQFEARRR